MIVVLLNAADEEMNAAAEHYELNRSGLGDEFLNEVDRGIGLLRTYRYAGHIVNGADDKLREFALSKFPYRLIYFVRERIITIVSVAHQSRRPGYWVDRIQEPPAIYQLAA